MKKIQPQWTLALCLPLIWIASCSEPVPEPVPAPVEPETVIQPDVPAQPEPEPPGAIIEGKASVDLRIQKIRILGGIELVLIPEEASEKIMTIRNQQWLINASRNKFNDGYNNLDLNMIGGTAVELSVARTKADPDGNYRLAGVTPGRYRLYGQYKSRYASGYWLVPVEIKSSEDKLSLDLTHENMQEVHNREIKY